MTTVRNFEPRDEPHLRRIAIQNYAEQLPDTESIDPGDPAVQAYLQHIIQIQESGNGVIVLAEQGKKLIGFVCLLGPGGTAADKKSEDAYAYMSDLFVIPECRGKGVGSLLTKTVEEQARAMGADYVALRIAADNTGSLSFYVKKKYQEKYVVMSKRFSDQGL